MTNQAIIDKLVEMKLTSMADAFRIQESDPSMKEVSFEDLFDMLLITSIPAVKITGLSVSLRMPSLTSLPIALRISITHPDGSSTRI